MIMDYYGMSQKRNETTYGPSSHENEAAHSFKSVIYPLLYDNIACIFFDPLCKNIYNGFRLRTPFYEFRAVNMAAELNLQLTVAASPASAVHSASGLKLEEKPSL